MDEQQSYDIKDAAHYLGVAPSTLRYWEREGLVRAGRNHANDYRQYALHDLIEASEIAFYRKLGVPVKELVSYRALSAHELDEALARTEDDIERRITELESMRTRLARQRALNADVEKLRRSGMVPGVPTMKRLNALDYSTPTPWKLLVEEPWRYGVLIEADQPHIIQEAMSDVARAGSVAVWQRRSSDSPLTCRTCLLKVSPSMQKSNAAALFAEATQQGLNPRRIVGSYLLTATEGAHRWDYHRAWVVS